MTNLYYVSIKQMNNYNEELPLLTAIFQEVKKELELQPQGSIHFTEKGGKLRFSLRCMVKDKLVEKYLVPSDSRVQIFVNKMYYSKIYFILKQYIDHPVGYNSYVNMRQKLREAYSSQRTEIKALIKEPIDFSDEDFIEYWYNIPSLPKTIHESAKPYFLDNKIQVRSKSERNIGNEAIKREYPIKYECPIKINEKDQIHPDFTILDVKNRRQIIWEHRGLMDNPDYANNAIAKEKALFNLGYVLGDNFFITEETSQYPLGTDEINAIFDLIDKRK